jgi:hypothetical protein
MDAEVYEKGRVTVKKQFRYGFTWGSLFWAFLILGAIALGALWLALTWDMPLKLGETAIDPHSAALAFLVVGGFFALGAGIVVSLMLQQRGMSVAIVLDKKRLLLPVTGRGDVSIPLAEITEWRIIEKSTRKTLWIEHQGRHYTVESRLMKNMDDFDAFAQALRAQAGKKETIAEHN